MRTSHDSQGREKTYKPLSAYDFTLSAPKSVSVLWSQVDLLTRKKIEQAHEQAVGAVASYLETNCCVTRGGKAGINQEQIKPIFAGFRHYTSREDDCQLHTHLLLLNTGLRSDGRGGAIDGRPLFGEQFTCGAIYRNTLRHELTGSLGIKTYDVELKNGGSFEISGVSSKLCHQLSKRHQQIEALKTPGDTPKQIQTLVLSTRKAKQKEQSLNQLLNQWQQLGKQAGFQSELVLNQTSNNKLGSLGLKALESQVSRSLARKQVIKDKTILHTVLRCSAGRFPQSQVEQFTNSYKARHLTRIDKTYLLNKQGIKSVNHQPVFQKLKHLPQKAYYLHRQTKYKVDRYLSQRRSKLFKRRVTYLYAIGRISRSKYLKYTKEQPEYPQGLVAQIKTTKAGINLAYATHRISSKQRKYLLHTHGHQSKSTTQQPPHRQEDYER